MDGDGWITGTWKKNTEKTLVRPNLVVTHIIETSRSPRDRTYTTNIKHKLKILNATATETEYAQPIFDEEIAEALKDTKPQGSWSRYSPPRVCPKLWQIYKNMVGKISHYYFSKTLRKTSELSPAYNHLRTTKNDSIQQNSQKDSGKKSYRPVRLSAKL